MGCDDIALAWVHVRKDEILDFAVSVNVYGVTQHVKFFHWGVDLELFDNKFKLNTGVTGEDISRVHSVKLEWPILDNNDMAFQVCNIDTLAVCLESFNSFLREVAGNVEVVVGNEEIGEAFFDVALDLVLHLAHDFVDVATVLEHFAVEKLECWLFSGHFL